jgi:hypothetical protein
MFVELMTHQAGVRTISVGGRPVTGPMQTTSGTRGAREYTADTLDYDVSQLNSTLDDIDAWSEFPRRDDPAMWINYASINIRDQMRENNETPLQFQYLASQCRIYYTLDNIYNMTRLWRDAASATWEDRSLCVEDSTGYAPGPNGTESKPPPERNAQSPILDSEVINTVGFQVNSTGGLDGILRNANTRPSSNTAALRPCDARTPCDSPLKCQRVVAVCPGGGYVWPEFQPQFCLVGGQGQQRLAVVSRPRQTGSVHLPVARYAQSVSRCLKRRVLRAGFPTALLDNGSWCLGFCIMILKRNCNNLMI